jgi:hypothetical protein
MVKKKNAGPGKIFWNKVVGLLYIGSGVGRIKAEGADPSPLRRPEEEIVMYCSHNSNAGTFLGASITLKPR